jgi:hypothetical protein
MMMVDGDASTLWAHGKPKDYPHEHFTLVFKCPEFRTKTHETKFEYEGASLNILFYYKQDGSPCPGV